MGSIPVFLINAHRIDSVADAEAYVARLRDVERVMGEISANMRHQVELGIVPPRFNFAPVRADGRRILVGAPFTDDADGPLFADFKAKVGRLQIADAEKARLIAAARDALTGPFRRGYETMLATLDAIEPRAAGDNGAWSLPDGAAYADRLRQSTTTDLSAEQIHQIGLQQVARLHGEMERIRRQVGFTGTLREFFRHVTESQQFKYPNTAEGRERYLADARRYIGQVMAAAPRMFRRLPRAPLEVRAVEAFRQDTASVAFYNQPSADGSRPGIFYVNLADMNQVLRPQVEAIAYHEGAPGHHFQVALAQELEGAQVRRFGGYGAYRRLGPLFRRPGQGARLLPGPDVGVRNVLAVAVAGDPAGARHRHPPPSLEPRARHPLFHRERPPVRARHRQGGRPLFQQSRPGDQLHDRAAQDPRAARPRRAALGDRFDLRDFHAVVLENGAVPLDVLEELVDGWIATRRNG